MMTTLDIIDLLWTKLDGSALKSAITGKMYKLLRLANSKKEDVVINCLPINNEQLSKTIANINIHVPDLTIEVDGIAQQVPDIVRLKSLAALAISILKDTWTSTLNYDVQQQVVIQDREAGDHYINIRLEFNIINL